MHHTMPNHRPSPDKAQQNTHNASLLRRNSNFTSLGILSSATPPFFLLVECVAKASPKYLRVGPRLDVKLGCAWVDAMTQHRISIQLPVQESKHGEQELVRQVSQSEHNVVENGEKTVCSSPTALEVMLNQCFIAITLFRLTF